MKGPEGPGVTMGNHFTAVEVIRLEDRARVKSANVVERSRSKRNLDLEKLLEYKAQNSDYLNLKN